MSVRTEQAAPSGATPPGGDLADVINAAQPEAAALGEGSSYQVASPNHPLQRNIVVSIRATLNELCLQRQKGVWSPSSDSLKSIFRQRRFKSLDGSAEAQGDLKSMVLHDLSVNHVKSTFPIALGARITGVDDRTFGVTGDAFSTIVLPNAESTVSTSLQADDVSLGVPPPWPCLATPLAHLAPCAYSRSIRVLEEGEVAPQTPRTVPAPVTAVRLLVCGSSRAIRARI